MERDEAARIEEALARAEEAIAACVEANEALAELLEAHLLHAVSDPYLLQAVAGGATVAALAESTLRVTARALEESQQARPGLGLRLLLGGRSGEEPSDGA